MSARQAGGRRGGRDAAGKDNDIEIEFLNSIRESLRKIKELSDRQTALGQEIIILEEELKLSSTSKSKASAMRQRLTQLDDIYRNNLRLADLEKKTLEDEDVINKIAILGTMRDNDEPAPTRERGGNVQKSRTKSHQQRPIVESDVSVDGSGGVSPAETTASANPRVEVLKRKQSSHTPRGATPSGGRPVINTTTKDSPAKVLKDPVSAISEQDQILHKGLLAERSGDLKISTEVFYKYPRSVADDVGVGIQCIIKKVHADRTPIIYDVQDPEPDPNGKQSVHKATARDLYPIPPSSGVGSLGNDSRGLAFQPGTTVFARYPDTDTFYRAKVVRGLKAGEYTLRFEGEEDDTEKAVERRFVLDTRMR